MYNARTSRSRIRRIIIPVVAAAFAMFLAGCGTSAPAKSGPKNVIVLIGDGMGFAHVTASSYYETGTPDGLSYQQFPVQYGMSTYSASGIGYNQVEANSDFDYFKKRPTDSAAAATAMGTGKKSYNGAIGVDMDKEPIINLCEIAEKAGKASGVATSVNFPHATPAGYIAHTERRGNLQDIARQMVFSNAEVIMGAGHPLYDNDGQLLETPDFSRVDTEAVWNMLVSGGTEADGNTVQDIDGDGKADAWTLVETPDDFEALTTGATPKRVFGLARTASTLQQRRAGDRKTEVAFQTPFLETVPSIATITKAAINVLSKNPNGFFLMVEAGGAVDWASHSNESGRMLEEQIEMNRAVDAVIEWVEANSSWEETLVIVTADHETGYLCGPESGNITGEDGKVTAVWNPITGNGIGEMPNMAWYSGGHTNQLVPFYAKGAGSELFEQYADEWDAKHGYYINNTEYAQLIERLWD